MISLITHLTNQYFQFYLPILFLVNTALKFIDIIFIVEEENSIYIYIGKCALIHRDHTKERLELLGTNF